MRAGSPAPGRFPGSRFILHPSSFILMQLPPLGDQAVLAYLPDEAAAVRFAAAVRAADPPWLHDVVPAYASVGIFFDADTTRLPDVLDWLTRIEPDSLPRPSALGTRHFVLPVCYEFGP